MARLPTVNEDENNWGTLLNEFLLVAHRENGQLRSVGEVVNVRDFGATGDGSTDDTQAIQAAIDTAKGRTVYIPTGTYVVTTTLNYVTSGTMAGLRLIGAGMLQTLFDNRVSNGPLLNIDGGKLDYYFQWGGLLADFSIITTTASPGSRGIEIRANWHLTLERIWIKGLTSDGIRVNNLSTIGPPEDPCQSSDADSTAYLRLEQVVLSNNGGFGFNTYVPKGPGALGPLEFNQCAVEHNQSGGIKLYGVFALTVVSTSISWNKGMGGLIFPAAPPQPPECLSRIPGSGAEFMISRCEFDTNENVHILLEYGVLVNISENKFISQEISGVARTTTSVQLGSSKPGSLVWSAMLARNGVQNKPASAPHTAFDIRANAQWTRIEDTGWHSFEETQLTKKYIDAGVFTLIRERGGWIQPAMKVVYKGFTTPGSSYAPSLLEGLYHQITLRVGGTFTLLAPEHAVGDGGAGRELLLDIVNFNFSNNPTEATKVTFDPIYRMAGYTDPTPGYRRTVRLIFDGASWVQCGAWSPDLQAT